MDFRNENSCRIQIRTSTADSISLVKTEYVNKRILPPTQYHSNYITFCKRSVRLELNGANHLTWIPFRCPRTEWTKGKWGKRDEDCSWAKWTGWCCCPSRTRKNHFKCFNSRWYRLWKESFFRGFTENLPPLPLSSYPFFALLRLGRICRCLASRFKKLLRVDAWNHIWILLYYLKIFLRGLTRNEEIYSHLMQSKLKKCLLFELLKPLR